MLPIDSSNASKHVKDTFLDANSLNGVKAMGRDHDPQALKEIAKKFEAIFVQEMMKNMRAANEVFADGNYLNSNETQFHQDMLDQQMSLELTSGRGLGLADALYEQMQRAYGHESRTPDENSPAMDGRLDSHSDDLKKMPIKDLHSIFHRQQMLAAMNADFTENQNPFEKGEQGFASDASANSSSLYSSLIASAQAERAAAMSTRPVNSFANSPLVKGGKSSVADSPADFINTLKPYAQKAAAELNVSAEVLLAQAALETGWGKHVIHSKAGGNSFNLFNIKADASWKGDKVNVSTLEYHQGQARQERADFRRYDNYAQSFSDYVNFLQTNPRYQQALQVGVDPSAYAEALQDAGYATDPAYADKIKNLLGSDPIRSAAETLVALASDNTGS